jgi:hypothetical protein
MTDALKITGNDLARALARAALSPAVDAAVRTRAETVARDAGAGVDGVTTRVLRRDTGDYVVSIEGPGLFARAFGSLDAPADPAIADAIAGLTE